MTGYAWFHAIAYLCMIIVVLEIGVLLAVPLLGIGLGGFLGRRWARRRLAGPLARVRPLPDRLFTQGARYPFSLVTLQYSELFKLCRRVFAVETTLDDPSDIPDNFSFPLRNPYAKHFASEICSHPTFCATLGFVA